MRDLVAVMYGNVAVHTDVKIDVIIQAHLAGMTFLHLDNTRDRGGNALNGPDNFFTGRRIHRQLARGKFQ